jgi:hypothetical protein
LITARRQAGRHAAFTRTLVARPRPNASPSCAPALVSKPQSAASTSPTATADAGSWDDRYISFAEEVA